MEIEPETLRTLCSEMFEPEREECLYALEEFKDPEKLANAKGLIVIRPKPTQIFIDIDSEKQYNLFQKRWEVLANHVLLQNIEERPSKSGLPKRHIIITFKTILSIWQKIALQSVLGSDPVREILHASRMMEEGKAEICFFEPQKPENTNEK